ncbi:MAG: CvpA family protein [Spiribacter sp.]|jgi:membrane protein required for colicin V production|nr:CvpA family protein [Spiribacter sp.]MDR9489004.1 CvpA family protein [Spiribacter sp.]
MNWLDYAFLGVIGVSVLIGVIRGFVREIISVVVWVAAFWIATRYSTEAADMLSPWLASSMLRLVVGFAGLFIITLVIGALVGYLGRTLVGKTGLSGTDRILGLVFGGLRGGLIVGLVVLGAGLTGLPQASWWQESLIAEGYRPWVCHQRIGGWLEGAQQYGSLAQSPMDGSAALAYWQTYCANSDELASNRGS